MSSIRDFGGKGDGRTDDTEALRHAVEEGDGHVVLPRGDYVIRRTVQVPLAKIGRFSLSGEGGVAKLIWQGSGPLLHLIGTHGKTADPKDFAEGVWQKERMPTITEVEIVGQAPDSDGIRLEGVMQPTIQRVLIRRCRHGIHLTTRNRNVIIADCHIHDCRGVGVFLDRVNLHQINIHGNHVSYCKRGGIVVANSEVRNIQICSNDIEYNYDLNEPESADVWFDARNGTIREGTIAGNTIQAKPSPGGANVRLTGTKESPTNVGMLSITGNLIGSQQTLLHLKACRGVVVSGNAMYHGELHAVLAEDGEHLVLDGNSHDHNPEYKGKSTDAHVYRRCRNLNLTGLLIQHTAPAAGEVEATVSLSECENVSFSDCQIINARTRGVQFEKCYRVRVAGCTIRGARDAGYRSALDWDAATTAMVVNNFLAAGADGPHPALRDGISSSGNVII